MHMENAGERSSISRVGYDFLNPCNFLKEAVNAIFKCLGFESNIPSRSNEKESDESSCGWEDHGDHHHGQPPTDPTNVPALELDIGARRGRTPPRPGFGGGRDPQTN